MEFKGTKGEWEVRGSINDTAVLADGIWMCDISKGRIDSLEEQQANAHLISAAPDLLEALNELLHCHETYGRLATEGKAKNAIAKALNK